MDRGEERESGRGLARREELPAPVWEELPDPFRAGLQARHFDAELEFDRAVGYVRRLVMRRVPDPEERREVWSLTWLAICGSLHTFDPRIASLSTWAWAICSRVIARFYNRSWLPLEPLPEDYEGLFEHSNPSPEELVLNQERAEQVRRAFRRLPRLYREPLHLKYYHDLTYADIASRLSVTRNQVAQKIRDGLKALREILLGLEGEDE